MRMLDISPYCWEKMVLTMGSTLVFYKDSLKTCTNGCTKNKLPYILITYVITLYSDTEYRAMF